MIVLGLSMQSFAETHTHHQQVHLHAINPSNAVIEKPIDPDVSALQSLRGLEPHPARTGFIRSVLLDHWQQTSNDPPSLMQDLEKMASYFSQFPQVHALFKALDAQDWSLRYGDKTFETKIEGKNMAIENIEVVFDPRSAAQFRFNKACDVKKPYCIASPADVLLHELLHVRSILANPQEFIASGGLSNMLYPYEHERNTIESERKLYRAMSAHDEQARPLRNEHSGRHVLVACVTCIQ